MIRLKAKQQEKKAEEEAQQQESAAATSTATAAGDDSSAAAPAEKPKTVKILGVGRGKRAGASKEKKRTPGEIRIQKGWRKLTILHGRNRLLTCTWCADIAELDGGQAATVSFPEVNDLTVFNVKVRPRKEFWCVCKDCTANGSVDSFARGTDLGGHGSVEGCDVRL